MPPRRGTRGRGRGGYQKRGQNQGDANDSQFENGEENDIEMKGDASNEMQNGSDPNIDDDSGAQGDESNATNGDNDGTDAGNEDSGKNEDGGNKTQCVDLPYKIKVSHLPAAYSLPELDNYLQTTFELNVPKIIAPGKNSPWVLLAFPTAEERDNCLKLLHNHNWKKKALRAIAYYGAISQKHGLEGDEEGPDNKRLKFDDSLPEMTLEEVILSESLPLFNIPYEEQNRLTLQDVQLLSNKLHAFMCVRNPDLAGWAEAMVEKNGGTLFKIEPLKTSALLEGYRNKCKFRIGKNAEGQATVGFCLNDNENKILGVQPGDKLIHLPDSMKYAAKKFDDFMRASGKEPYDKKSKSGLWDHIIIRVAPEGSLMLVVVMHHNNLSEEEVEKVKNDLKEFFVNGEGQDCNLYSLYLQIMNDKSPLLTPDKLHLLHGEPHFYENICGVQFYVGPFTMLNVNSSSSENIYQSVAELAEPTPETTILDLCSGTGGIAFTMANKCKQAIGIESQEGYIKDAMKTMEANKITNVEFVKGKVEEKLSEVFEKLGEDATIIPVIDPPRQGLVQKAISQLRSNEKITKLVYVCANSKMGAKNFLDLCASADKKEGTFGNPLNVAFAGLPFLPVRAIPIDVAPYTVNNTIVILFERTDPSTFPPAKNPPPQPLKKPQEKKDEKKKRSKRPQGSSSSRSRKSHYSSSPRGRMRRSRLPPPRYPQPLMARIDPAMSLVAKYERRIAELEQQDRAFKAGLSMGLQALGTRGGAHHGGAAPSFDSFANNYSQGGNMGSMGNNYGGGNYRSQMIGNNPAWQHGGSRSGYDSSGYGSGGGGGYGGYNTYSRGYGGSDYKSGMGYRGGMSMKRGRRRR